MDKDKKKLGKSHWRESRKEPANLNQKGGPMGSKKERELEKVRQKDGEEPLFCAECGIGITWTDVNCQEGYCEVCFQDKFGSEYNDTLDEPKLPEGPKPNGGYLNYRIIHYDDPDFEENK